ncbi:MAG: BlaI/MecI/CopY family transcriptional regulator [Pirellulaceae bacterium]
MTEASSIPSQRELQALKILWDRGEATVRDIAGSLEQRGESLAYTTILSLMQTMEQKGLVGHKAAGKTYSYFPKVGRDSTFRSLARGFLDNVFDGAMDEYLLHALQTRKLSADEIARLEKLISQAKDQTGRKGSKGVSP